MTDDYGIRRAMQAAGVDPDAVVETAALDHVIPSDEEEAERQSWRDAGGVKCAACGERVDPNASQTLREVIGWDRPRGQGGQNHVLFREETGRLMCGSCAVLKQRPGGASQEQLAV